jgi:hypothetical protein
MKPGQKVVCVQTSSDDQVVKGEIYTVDCLYKGICNGEPDIGVVLYEVKPIDPNGAGFSIRLFRPVDYTFGEKIVEFIEEVVCDA